MRAQQNANEMRPYSMIVFKEGKINEVLVFKIFLKNVSLGITKIP